MARKDAGRHRGSLNNGFEQCSPGFIRLEASHQVSVRTSSGCRATRRPYFSGVFPSGLHVTTQGMLSAGDSMRTDPKDRDMHTRFLKYSDASPCKLGNGNVSRAGAKEYETILRIQNNLRANVERSMVHVLWTLYCFVASLYWPRETETDGIGS